MLIGGDGNSNNVITLVTRFSMFFYIRSFPLRTDWRKSDSSVTGGATGELEVEFKFQRRSCKLSFLFPSRRQSTLESLLAGLLVCGKKVGICIPVSTFKFYV